MTLPPDDRSANLLIWVVLWSALAAWQAVTVVRGWPRLAAVVCLLRRWRATRWLLLLGWGWLGWHLFVRTTA